MDLLIKIASKAVMSDASDKNMLKLGILLMAIGLIQERYHNLNALTVGAGLAIVYAPITLFKAIKGRPKFTPKVPDEMRASSHGWMAN